MAQVEDRGRYRRLNHGDLECCCDICNNWKPYTREHFRRANHSDELRTTCMDCQMTTVEYAPVLPTRHRGRAKQYAPNEAVALLDYLTQNWGLTKYYDHQNFDYGTDECGPLGIGNDLARLCND